MTKKALLLALALPAALLARPARAQTPYDGSPPPLPRTAAPAAAASGSFGGEILAADLLGFTGGLALSVKIDNAMPLVGAWLLAAPAVHAAHGDASGAVASAALHLLAPVAGAFIGYKIDTHNCSGEDIVCGVGGLVLGGLLGGVTATFIDAIALSKGPREVSRGPVASAPTRLLPTPMVAVNPNGGFVVGVGGRL